MICIFVGCHGHDDKQDAILHGQEHLAAEVADVKRILRAIFLKEGFIMTDVETLASDFAKYQADVTAKFAALLAAIEAEGAGRIPPAVQAEIDALDVSINGADADANAVVVPDPDAPTDPTEPTDPTTPVEPTDPGTDVPVDPSAPVDAPTEV